MIEQLVVMVLVFLFLQYLLIVDPILFGLVLFIFMWFVLAVFDLSILQKVFYIVGPLFFLVFALWVRGEVDYSQEAEPHGSVPAGKFSLKEANVDWLAMGIQSALGAGIWVSLQLMGGGFQASIIQGNSVLSVPGLQVVTTQGIVSAIQRTFTPALSGVAGLIENASWVAILYITIAIFSKIPAIGTLITFGLSDIFPPIVTFLSILVSGGLFGLFHLATGLPPAFLIFAAIAGMMFLSSYWYTKSMGAMNVSHYFHNAIITTAKSLKIASG